MAASPFRILTVCTGNICRSPAAGLLLAADLADDSRFAVSSAGTHAMVGWPISPPMGDLLAERGISDVGFVARQATAATLAESDLILTATREHREWVAGHEPRVVRRTFTLTEFADAVRVRTLETDASPTQLVAWAASNRPSMRVTDQGPTTRRGYAEGDILDPYGRGNAAYVASLRQIEPLISVIARALLAAT